MLSVDYGFFGDPGAKLVTFVVAYLRPFGVYGSSVVDAKGPTAYAVRVLSEWILQCGLVKLLYQADREGGSNN